MRNMYCMPPSFYAAVQKGGKFKEITSMAEDHEMIFDRAYMDIYLDQFETFFDGTAPTYDDVVAISVSNVIISTITDLPVRLHTLIIMTSTINAITIPVTCQSLRKLYVYNSNLTAVPQLGRVSAHLEYVNFSRAQIERFADTAWFTSPVLRELVLEQNYISDISPELLAFRRKLVLRNNPRLPKRIQDMSTNYRDLHGYVHQTVTIQRVNRAQARNAFANIVDTTNVSDTGNVLTSAGGQTVHISSINRSICKSVRKIMELSAAEQAKRPQSNASAFERQMRMELTKHWSFMAYINTNQTHSVLNITYCELLTHVWRVATSLPAEQCANVKDRIKAEIADGNGMCFTGQMNRLVNALVGMDIHPDITVSYSLKEQLQMELGSLIKQYTALERTYAQVVDDINAMFEGLTPDEMAEEKIPLEYKGEWLVSMRDLHIDRLETELEPCETSTSGCTLTAHTVSLRINAIQAELWALQLEAWAHELAAGDPSEAKKGELKIQIAVRKQSVAMFSDKTQSDARAVLANLPVLIGGYVKNQREITRYLEQYVRTDADVQNTADI